MVTLFPFFVTCELSAEGALRRELVELRIRAPKGARGGVSFRGTFEEGMRVCLHARTAMRVLLELADFQAPNAQALYEGTRTVAWHEHLTDKQTFAVKAQVSGSDTLINSQFAGLKVKDAIVDALRDKLGQRPNVDPQEPDVLVALHINGTHARLFLDLSGEPLHRRGYRVAMTEAPLKETLAAAILALGNVPTDEPFIDPMAGSGTLAIEQALKARRIAPGARRRFGFQRWPSEALRANYPAMLENAKAEALSHAPAPIWARDVDPQAISALRQNALAAGVGNDIEYAVANLGSLTAPAPHGTLCTNPPYGERLERNARQTRDISRELATAFHRLWGWNAVLLCPDPSFVRALTIQPEFSHRLWNGGIEVRLMRFALGTRPASASQTEQDS
ncbi:MAG: THUMP domain-containing protein [Deltaproteobacteria bacterium]|nr:THUMP domain-containing protein [Deltaproteobacteria bacterium]